MHHAIHSTGVRSSSAGTMMHDYYFLPSIVSIKQHELSTLDQKYSGCPFVLSYFHFSISFDHKAASSLRPILASNDLHHLLLVRQTRNFHLSVWLINACGNSE